jgi:hypothetical protein
MLGVLKSKNYDNYKDLVKLVATNEKNAYLYKSIKEKYPYLAA